MNQQYPNSREYPLYVASQQPLKPPSRPQSNGLPQPTSHALPLPASHALPRMATGNYAPIYSHDNFVPRPQRVQPSSTSSHTDFAGQPYNGVYGPTANLYSSQGTPNFGQAPQVNPPLQRSRPPSTSALPQSQPQAAYLPALSQGSLRDIAPAPRQDGKPSLALGNVGNPEQAEDESQPVHVVGSQGRRGILPSATGRPSAIPGGNANGQKGAPTPTKDSEGKYPCPHCTKHYLHAKHLKRHLLRHTGVRPYSCGLCKDTFSRSDILKRHFIKCSDRRGNPSGESHLAHSRASKKARAQEEEAARMESTTPTMIEQSEQIANYTPTSADGHFDISSLNLNQAHYSDRSNQVSRSNSVKNSKKSAGGSSNRASLTLVSTSGYEPIPASYTRSGHATPDSAQSHSGAVTPYQYTHGSRSHPLSPNGTLNHGLEFNFSSVSMPPGSSTYANGPFPHIHPGNEHSYEWSQFSPRFNSHDDYGHQQFPSGTNTPLQRVKSEIDITHLPLNDFTYMKTPSSSGP